MNLGHLNNNCSIFSLRSNHATVFSILIQFLIFATISQLQNNGNQYTHLFHISLLVRESGAEHVFTAAVSYLYWVESWHQAPVASVGTTMARPHQTHTKCAHQCPNFLVVPLIHRHITVRLICQMDWFQSCLIISIHCVQFCTLQHTIACKVHLKTRLKT